MTRAGQTQHKTLRIKTYRAMQRLLTVQPMLHLLTLHYLLETHPYKISGPLAKTLSGS